MVLFGPIGILLYAMCMAAPRYKAEATLLIETHAERSPGSYAPVGQSVADSGDNSDRTQYALLKNRNLASLVIRAQALNLPPSQDDVQEEEPVVAARNNQPDGSSAVSIQAIEAYLRDLEIVPVPGTRLVKVAFSAPDPQLAARIANAHAETFIRLSREQARASQLQTSTPALVDKALPASRPTWSRTTLSLLYGIVLWTLGSGGVLYWSTHFNRRLKTPADVASMLDLATLGIIPDFSTKEVRAEGVMPLRPKLAALPGFFPKELLLAYHPLSLVPEAYRNLRAELLLSCPSAPPRSLLMTSSMSSEGKTITVLNTAISLAQMGARVLVIDADLRHPHCHSILRMPKGLGLTEFLTGQRELAEVIQATRIERLFFLSGGAVPPNPAELLGSKRMRAAFSFFGHMYDYIVIDSPPLGLVRDALLLSPLVDGVVLVVNSQKTLPKIVQEAQQRLAHVHAKILGVVSNKMDMRSRDYVDYCRRYRAYYRQTGGASGEFDFGASMGLHIVPTAGRTVPEKKVRKTPRKAEAKANAPRLSVASPRMTKKEAALLPPPTNELSANTIEPTEARKIRR